MKSTELKKMIKEAVKEAIQEELKDILLEAVRSPKTVVSENVSIPTPQLSSQPKTNAKEERVYCFGFSGIGLPGGDQL